MNPMSVSLISAGCTFAGVLVGLSLRNFLPDHHLSKDAQETVKLGAGMLATVTALVMGLLVSSAKSAFDGMNASLVQSSTNMIVLDRLLAEYGPETKEARAELRKSVTETHEKLWGKNPAGGSRLSALEAARGMQGLETKLHAIVPRDFAQRQMLKQAHRLSEGLMENRWLLIEEAQHTLPTPFLAVLICWLTMLYVSFALFAPRNATVITVLILCALSVSAAIFLVLEMDRPLDGIIHLSSAPLRTAIDSLGQ